MLILGRSSLLNLVKSEPKKHKAIIIHEPNKYDRVSEIVDNCESSLVLEMDDTTTIRSGAPTKDQVEAAIQSGYDIVSCKQGISRSSAIAFLIASSKSTPEEAINILDVNKHFPNELILKYGVDILGDSIKQPIFNFYKKIAENKGWQINMVTKYFREYF